MLPSRPVVPDHSDRETSLDACAGSMRADLPGQLQAFAPRLLFERRRSAQHQTARFDFVRRRLRFVAGRPPARQTVLNAGRGLAYAARPRGILELGYIPARLSLNNFCRFVCDPQGNLSDPTSAIHGVAKPVPCNLALDGEEVL